MEECKSRDKNGTSDCRKMNTRKRSEGARSYIAGAQILIAEHGAVCHLEFGANPAEEHP